MRFLYANEFLTDGYTITENSEDASYPVENAQDPQLSRKYWTTGDSAEWVKVDGGASEAITANCAFIAGHNLTSGGTYAIEGNDTDVWTSPTVDEAFSHDSGVMFKAFTSDDLRYETHFLRLAQDGTPIGGITSLNNDDQNASAGVIWGHSVFAVAKAKNRVGKAE